MDLVRLSILPPLYDAREITRRIIEGNGTPIVKSTRTSPWEVFLRAEHAARVSIHYCEAKTNVTKGRR
jgi:hypothetical protein